MNIKQCVSVFYDRNITRHSPSLYSTDAVVLWDWIISLPREWKYVGSPSSYIYNASKTVHPRSGRHLGHQLKQRTYFAGMNASTLLSHDSMSTVTGSSRSCPTCFTPSSTTTVLKLAKKSTRYATY